MSGPELLLWYQALQEVQKVEKSLSEHWQNHYPKGFNSSLFNTWYLAIAFVDRDRSGIITQHSSEEGIIPAFLNHPPFFQNCAIPPDNDGMG